MNYNNKKIGCYHNNFIDADVNVKNLNPKYLLTCFQVL